MNNSTIMMLFCFAGSGHGPAALWTRETFAHWFSPPRQSVWHWPWRCFCQTETFSFKRELLNTQLVHYLNRSIPNQKHFLQKESSLQRSILRVPLPRKSCSIGNCWTPQTEGCHSLWKLQPGDDHPQIRPVLVARVRTFFEFNQKRFVSSTLYFTKIIFCEHHTVHKNSTKTTLHNSSCLRKNKKPNSKLDLQCGLSRQKFKLHTKVFACTTVACALFGFRTKQLLKWLFFRIPLRQNHQNRKVLSELWSCFTQTILFPLHFHLTENGAFGQWSKSGIGSELHPTDTQLIPSNVTSELCHIFSGQSSNVDNT